MAEIKLTIRVAGADAIPAAMKQASAAVAEDSAKITATLQAAGKNAGTALSATLPPAAAQAGRQANSALADAFAKGITESSRSNLAKEFAQGISGSTSAASNSVNQFERSARASFTRARDSVDLLANSIGVGIPRELKKVIAGIGPIQGLMSAAFGVFALTSFVQVLSQIPQMLDDAAASLAGWSAKAQEAWNTSLDINKKFQEASLKARDAAIENAKIGLEGSAAQAKSLEIVDQKIKNIAGDHRGSSDAVREATKEVDRLKVQVEDLQKKTAAGTLGGLVGGAYFYGQLRDAQKALAEAQARVKSGDLETAENQIKLTTDLKIERERGAKELTSTLRKEERALELARIEADSRASAASISLAEASAKATIALSDSTAAEEALIFQGLEIRKFEAAKQGIERQQAEARKLAATDPGGSATKLVKLKGDMESLEASHQARMVELSTQGQVGTLAAERAAAAAEISAFRETAEQRFSIEQNFIEQQAAQRRLSIDEERELREVAETTRHQEFRNSITAQLEQAEEFPEKNKTLIIQLHQQLEAEELQHQANIAAIRAQAVQEQQELSLRMAEQQRAAAERAADFELEQAHRINQQRLDAGQEFLGKWEAEELASINRWYEQQRSILQQSLEQARAVYGENSSEYQRMLDRMTELERDRITKVQTVQDQITAVYQRGFDQINENLLGNLKQWALGQQTIKQAFQNVWNEMVLDLAASLARMGLKWLAHWALVNILHIGAKSQQVATEATAAAATHAIQSATAIGRVISQAAIAGAAGFSSVMIALPFPANVAVAPGVGAASFAGAAAYAPLAAFEGGGIVKSTDIALLHKNEMVLPSNLSQGFQSILKSGSPAAGSGASFRMGDIVFNTPVDRKTADYATREIAAAVKRAIRDGFLGEGDFA